jgi:hypothetical protein
MTTRIYHHRPAQAIPFRGNRQLLDISSIRCIRAQEFSCELISNNRMLGPLTSFYRRVSTLKQNWEWIIRENRER